MIKTTPATIAKHRRDMAKNERRRVDRELMRKKPAGRQTIEDMLSAEEVIRHALAAYYGVRKITKTSIPGAPWVTAESKLSQFITDVSEVFKLKLECVMLEMGDQTYKYSVTQLHDILDSCAENTDQESPDRNLDDKSITEQYKHRHSSNNESGR